MQKTRKKRKTKENLDLIEIPISRARARMYREALRLDKERAKTKRIYEV
jgi:hypothetical protein